MFQKNIVEYGWNDKYGWGWRWIWINSLPGMCHVKRTSQAKLSIFVTFWDSFMTHVLTWRNLGSVLYYRFSHLTRIWTYDFIETHHFLLDLLGPRPWAQRLPAALQKCLPKYAKWIKMGQLMQNCKSSSKIHCKSRWYQDTCAQRWPQRRCQQALRETWNVLYSTSTPWSDKNSTHDTW